jgi:cell division protein FtsW (lipid II flippase)
VFYLASVFRKKLKFKQMLLPIAAGALYVLILVLQTDLGGALIFFMTFMVMLYVATGSELLFIAGMGAMSTASVLAYRLFSHVRVRVAIWQNPWADVYDTGNQIVQALFAIGTWGLLGSGLTLGYPGYVPVIARDSIFAAVCEEMGSLFGMGLIGVYLMVFYRGAHIALRCKRKYYSLLAVGFTAMMAFQTFLIIGGTIKLIPLTGVTLPFVSYGGSSALVSSLMIGIIQWIFMYYREDMDKSEED